MYAASTSFVAGWTSLLEFLKLAPMDRRDFTKQALVFTLSAAWRENSTPPSTALEFSTRDTSWQTAYDKALTILANNVQVLPRFDRPS